MTSMNQPETAPWEACISDLKWPVYRRVIEAAKTSGRRFALGGAFAVATHTGRWRGTKDIDFYVLPEERQAMINVLTASGMRDYFDVLPYDRSWIYRGFQDDVIADIIWGMPNRRGYVSEGWLERGPLIEVRGERLQILPAEEMIWAKIYVLQKDRSDWPDILNILHFAGEKLDWPHLFGLLDDDLPLLSGVMAVFSWLSPHHAAKVPAEVWAKLGLIPPAFSGNGKELHHQRIEVLDSRPWFGPEVDENEA